MHLQIAYMSIHKTVFASEWVQGKYGKNLDFFTSFSKTSVGNKNILFHVLQKEVNVSACWAFRIKLLHLKFEKNHMSKRLRNFFQM